MALNDQEPVWVLELEIPECTNEIQDEFKNRVCTMSAAYDYIVGSKKSWTLIRSRHDDVAWQSDDRTILMAHIRYKYKWF
jgi:hypothetical protein